MALIHLTTNTGEIQKAIDLAKSQRPAYGELLKFYTDIFRLQEKAFEDAKPPVPEISDDLIRIKEEEAMPLIDHSQFGIDIKNAHGLFQDLINIPCFKDKKADLGNIPGKNDFSILSSAFLQKNQPVFKEYGEKYGMETDLLEFAIYSAILPSIKKCSSKLSKILKKEDQWNHGYCPVCGGLMSFSVLDENGGRHLFCGFCWHNWAVPRIFCPVCKDNQKKSHQYFYWDEEKEYRADICDVCNIYIKTVDLRKINRPFYPPLEQLISLHIDIKAGEKGYKSVGPVDL